MVDLLNACLKDEMARDPADRGLRRGRGRRQPRGATSAQVKGKGGVFKVTWGLQRAVRQRPGLQLAARRGQHRRPGDRARDPRAQAGGRDPVLRLHLAGLHAAPRRAGAHALALATTPSPRRWWCGSPTAGTSRAARSTTRRPARRSSPACPDSGSSAPPPRSMPTACSAPRSAARTRCSSSSTSTSTARPTTRRPIPAPTS